MDTNRIGKHFFDVATIGIFGLGMRFTHYFSMYIFSVSEVLTGFVHMGFKIVYSYMMVLIQIQFLSPSWDQISYTPITLESLISFNNYS
jgi:hypothetical protein